MKMIKILQAVSLVAILVFAVSCRSSRPTGRTYPRGYPTDPYPRRDYPAEYPRRDYPVYRGSDPNPGNLPPGQAKKVYGGKSAKIYAPGQRKKYAYRQYPLIIRRTPEIIIRRYNDGRYYYKNPDGLMYWQGYDDRLYLDEKYLKDMDYDKNEYNDWKYKGKNSNSGKGKGQGQGHGNGNHSKGNGKGKGRN